MCCYPESFLWFPKKMLEPQVRPSLITFQQWELAGQTLAEPGMCLM